MKGFVSTHFTSVKAGTSNSHMTPTVESREIWAHVCSLACAQLNFSTLDTVQNHLPREWCCPWWLGFHTSVNFRQSPKSSCNIGNPLLRLSSQVIPDCVKMTMKTSHHIHWVCHVLSSPKLMLWVMWVLRIWTQLLGCFYYKQFTHWIIFTALQAFFLPRRSWSRHVPFPRHGKFLHPCPSGELYLTWKSHPYSPPENAAQLKTSQHHVPPQKSQGRIRRVTFCGSRGHFFQRILSLVRFYISGLHELKWGKSRFKRGGTIG